MKFLAGYGDLLGVRGTKLLSGPLLLGEAARREELLRVPSEWLLPLRSVSSPRCLRWVLWNLWGRLLLLPRGDDGWRMRLPRHLWDERVTRPGNNGRWLLHHSGLRGELPRSKGKGLLLGLCLSPLLPFLYGRRWRRLRTFWLDPRVVVFVGFLSLHTQPLRHLAFAENGVLCLFWVRGINARDVSVPTCLNIFTGLIWLARVVLGAVRFASPSHGCLLRMV